MLKPSVPDFLAEVLAYIEAHRDEPLTVAELAAPDFELYPADFEPMRKGSYVEMYIAVEA